MKKIILLITILLGSLTSYAQDGLKFRTKNIESHAKARTADDNDLNQLKKTYALIKFEAIEPALKFEGNQKNVIENLFMDQYEPLVKASNAYHSNKTLQGKLELIKLLIKNEEEFRLLLDDKQKIYYLSYDPKKGFVDNYNFSWHFFTEKTLMEYKKELL